MENQSGFQIYSLSHCPYCLRAKQLLKQEGLQFHETVIADDDINGRSELYNRTGMKTFPQIFFKDEVIGGYSDLKNIFDQNGFEQFRKNQ